jgi:hypothetical protein
VKREKMNEIKRTSAIVVITGILLLGVLALATGIASAADSAKEELPGAEIQAVIVEIDEHVHELINGTKALHDNTEQIADNETLDEDLRADAEEVHVASHELLYIADDIQELVEELEDLAKDPAANKVEMGEAIDEIKEHLEEYTEVLEANDDLLKGEASQLKRLIRKMNKPAHAIPGDAGAGIHTQFHRIEGFSSAIYDSVKMVDELAADPDKNKADMRELVVEKLWGQLGDLGTAIDGMSDLIDQALSADPEDANALKCEDLLYEMGDVQDAISVHVTELAAMLQDPIVWEYPCMGAMNAHRLANGNTLIAEAFADRVIEVSVWRNRLGVHGGSLSY